MREKTVATITIRCIPFAPERRGGNCINCGEMGEIVYFAQAY
ncbi:MAG TPA: hypothetical protein DEP99_04065 [Nitrospiraceae bacterium]|nr:hypothetical protein [Nitrospiraceae bacterium]